MENIAPVYPLLPDRDRYIEEITSIWKTGSMTNYGEKARRFQKMLSDYLDCGHVELFVNGHSALMLAIQALELTGEVITSPFTFISTTHAIMQNGLTPVFGDIDRNYNLSPKSIERLITTKTSAIITPHIFGIPCDVDGIEHIAKKHGLKVIYDGAQAFGTKIHGKSIGSFGDVTMFSFHATKVFNSIEGGALVFKDKGLHEKLTKLRNFGISYGDDRMDVEGIGMNAKMNEFQAAMGIVNLPLVDTEIEKRRNLAEVYRERLADVKGIETYSYDGDIHYNYAYFPITVTSKYKMSRDDLWKKLKEQGIMTRKLYDTLTCDYSCYQGKDFVRDTIFAEEVSTVALDLPLYGTLNKAEAEYICEIIRKVEEN